MKWLLVFVGMSLVLMGMISSQHVAALVSVVFGAALVAVALDESDKESKP